MTNPECENYRGRMREICEGTADLPLAKINAYRVQWGLAPLDAGGVEVHQGKRKAHRTAAAKPITNAATASPRTSPVPHVAAKSSGCSGCGGVRRPRGKPNGYGPGSQLLKLWADMPHCDDCLRLAAQMDIWGKAGCQRRHKEIVEDILPRAKAWMADHKPWVHRVLEVTSTENAMLRIAIGRYVTQAIEAAEDRPKPKPKSTAKREQRPFLESPERPLPIDDGALPTGLDRGIVTGATWVFWPCLGALAIEAANQGLGLAVADHGLRPWQQAELQRIGVRWIEHDRPLLEAADKRKHFVSAVKAWWKPWVCLASPFDKSAWIDADAVVVGHIDGLFQQIPCVSTQRQFLAEGAGMYRKLAEYMFGRKATEPLKRFGNINTGVIGWERGEPIMQGWADACQAILLDPEKLSRCSVRDQTGYVIAASQRMINGQSTPKLLDDPYNWPADGLHAKQSSKRARTSLIPEELLQQARDRNPKAIIVHWLARTKPWGEVRGESGIGWRT